jgi:hypothetical protein
VLQQAESVVANAPTALDHLLATAPDRLAALETLLGRVAQFATVLHGMWGAFYPSSTLPHPTETPAPNEPAA